MKRDPSIKLKAVFLLIVFSLNIVLVFACSVGINMGYNSSHHPDEKAEAIHNHDKLQHEEEKTEVSHIHNKAHSHDDEIADHQHSEKSKDDCCTDEAIKFAQFDKRTPQYSEFSFQPAFFVVLLTSIYNFDILTPDKLIPQSKYLVRDHHPPIPEIRIAIQSFQI